MRNDYRFDPHDWLDLADGLGGGAESQARYRTAISRYYYACHLEGVRSTTDADLFEPEGDATDHEKLIAALEGSGGHSWQIGGLKRLRRMRNHADYHVDSPDGSRGCEICKALSRGGRQYASVRRVDVADAKSAAFGLYRWLAGFGSH